MTVRAAGEHALLVETGSLEAAHRLDALLRADLPPGVEDVVPGSRTVLVVAPAADRPRLEALLASLLRTALAPAGADGPGRLVEIPVVYDGEDLAEVAALSGLPAEEVAARHAASEFTVGWLGFAPGFAYLIGLDPALHVPRLAVPRTSVPPGSVAIAGSYSAVYPSASPGGWRLLGRTDVRVWDAAAEPPAMLPPGTRVRFRPGAAR
ncbi:allophanate hydrolase subunit 1 [Microbispora cellulosiformans]|uniref:Allophanate hydrolase subunit 1 n=1 Tax=Microbispora cellulosiformans TaxID=2614688 RepID=A0A5J5K8T9_9ACTN|nr:allophanate hydrolase subunit 1 [Microbispora cellulosiformans]KAA9380896.1 allophanate hydrolase subunit 1 [Microbispora cellulosiformans]